jgi:hypothetical protein
VHRVGVMTFCECCVDCPFPYHVIRCWVRTKPCNIGNGSPIYTHFLALNPQYPETLSLGLVIGSTGSHPSSSLSPSMCIITQSYRKQFFLFYPWCFFSGGLPFVLFQSNQELLFSSPFLNIHVLRVALYLAHWPPCLAASTTVSLEW